MRRYRRLSAQLNRVVQNTPALKVLRIGYGLPYGTNTSYALLQPLSRLETLQTLILDDAWTDLTDLSKLLDICPNVTRLSLRDVIFVDLSVNKFRGFLDDVLNRWKLRKCCLRECFVDGNDEEAEGAGKRSDERQLDFRGFEGQCMDETLEDGFEMPLVHRDLMCYPRSDVQELVRAVLDWAPFWVYSRLWICSGGRR